MNKLYSKQIELGNFCIELLVNILGSFFVLNLLQHTAMNGQPAYKPNKQTCEPLTIKTNKKTSESEQRPSEPTYQPTEPAYKVNNNNKTKPLW